jgi:hypothetical protein
MEFVIDLPGTKRVQQVSAHILRILARMDPDSDDWRHGNYYSLKHREKQVQAVKNLQQRYSKRYNSAFFRQREPGTLDPGPPTLDVNYLGPAIRHPLPGFAGLRI